MRLIDQNIHASLLAFGLMGIICSSLPIGALGAFPLADSSLVCNNQVQISLDENCEALIAPDDILEGYSGNWNELEIVITDENDIVQSNPVTGQHIGQNLTVTVTHLISGSSCSGFALIEDKLPPVLTCTDLTVPCFQELDNQLYPPATDNCDPAPSVNLVDFLVVNNDPCGAIVIQRTFVAVDDQNNFSTNCTQVLTTFIPALPSFPIDTSWECHIYSAFPNVIDPTPLTGNLETTGSGRPDVAIGIFCPFTVGHFDLVLNGCEENFSILRTWTVLNWCTGEVFTTGASGEDNIQLIKVQDNTPPTIQMNDYVVGTNVAATSNAPCRSIAFLPPANVADNCYDVIQRIYTPIGEATYLNGTNGNGGGLIPLPGLPIGDHIIVYQATDACGNSDTIHVTISVADLTAPVAVCDELTTVSLGVDGIALLAAAGPDDGSHDDCCLDSFAIRRMLSLCDPADTLFSDYAHFCCADGGDTVQVTLRAYDCSGNYNDCMVNVIVEDKIPPSFVTCPSPSVIPCEYWADSLEAALESGDFSVLDTFGLPEITDNCSVVILSDTAWWSMNECQQGTIWRSWVVTDPGQNNTLTCQSSVIVQHTSNWVVQFPLDVTVECGNEIPPTGEPEVFFDNCELIAVSSDDEVFTIVPDACFKIRRKWVLINWCVVNTPIEDVVPESSELQLGYDLNGDNQLSSRVFQDGLNLGNFDLNVSLNGAEPDGYIELDQVIKVVDLTPPVMNCPPLLEYCTEGNTCFGTVLLQLPTVDDCTDSISISVDGELGQGLGPFTNVAPGFYAMNFYAHDFCNNTSHCEVLAVVKDCKAPTPYCVNGLSITLEQDTVVTVHAENFDAGSFDNCAGPLHFSFSADVNHTTMDFDCFSIGFVVVKVYVTDFAGNQSVCETFVFVDDNQGVCQGPPLIGGKVLKENDAPVKNVILTLNGSPDQQDTTSVDGIYSFDVEFGKDYTVAARKDVYPLNGVTTFDLVLISKHILAIDTLDSPYKMIAADANNSNTITTADLVEIRKLILQITYNFPNGVPSWRFVPKAYTFPNPLNPFVETFPEVININDLDAATLDAHFVAIKVGDVNLSAIPTQ